MDRVTHHGSGKHQGVVKLRTAGQALIPCDFRVHDKPQGGQTKNEHFQQAKARGFAPEYVLMDGWYAGLENLTLAGHF
jgi:putative transposase